MSKPIAIIAGETNSISSEIIFKAWILKKKYKHKPLFIIGNFNLLNSQKKKLKYKIKLKTIKSNFKNSDLKGNDLPIFNVGYNQNKIFQKISKISKNYIFNCFNIATNLINKKKISGFINCPISKEYLFEKNYQGITEYLAKQAGKKGNEVMLIYNKKISVSPITTHIPLSQVSNRLNRSNIIKKIKTIDIFYKRILKKVPKIAVLGLNPHNFSPLKKSEEKKIIIPAIKIIKKKGIKITGPISTDTSFMLFNEKNFDIIIGMYHDQVLTPFKALFKYNAINITLGLPYIRISPDHGVAEDIVGKKISNPTSLIESIKFFNNINN